MLGNVRKHRLGETCGVEQVSGTITLRCADFAGHKGEHHDGALTWGDEPRERNYTESHNQREVVKWIRARPDWLVMRIENAAKRTAAQAARDKALGMEDGAPDLAVWLRDFRFFIEMKSLTGSVSDKQRRLHTELRKRGEAVLVGFGHEATIKILQNMERAWSYWHEDTRHQELRCVIERANNP